MVICLPQTIQKIIRIWDLDSIKISLYGVDDESTFFITRHKNAYENVRNNIVEFLDLEIPEDHKLN